MKLASWNVNSLRVRLPQVLEWIERVRPDILALQETKLPDAEFPAGEIQAAGYQVVFSGQRTYNGVAILSRVTAAEVITDIEGLDDAQRRIIGGDYAGIRVLNLYVPNGQLIGTEKYAYKLQWLTRVAAHIRRSLADHARLVVMGDFNIAPEDRDVHDPVAWAGRILCSDAERNAFRGILQAGLVDSFRLFDQPENTFSWWDYRAGAFRRNHGLRIDHVLLSEPLRSCCLRSWIDIEPRRSARPSDHAPALVELRT